MIIITGAKGFIGKNLKKRFDKDQVYEINEQYCYEDLNDAPWREVIQVYHLGAISDTTETDINKLFKFNIDFCQYLFQKALRFDVPVKYASSASVYGNTKGKINPLNYYAMSKAIIDYHVLDNMNKFKNIVGYRFFNVYGSGEEHKGTQASPIHTFTEQAKKDKVVGTFVGSEKFKRDFVWVEDAIDCMLMEKESGIYDVGTSKPITFQKVGELIAKKYNAQMYHKMFPEHLIGKYQTRTCAAKHFDKEFITVKQYLSTL